MWEPNVIQEVLFLKFGSPKEWERWISMKGLKQSPQSIIVKENCSNNSTFYGNNNGLNSDNFLLQEGRHFPLFLWKGLIVLIMKNKMI